MDELGFLLSDVTAAMSGRQADGVLRTLFTRKALEDALWSYGEDDRLEQVAAGLSAEQVYRIGVADYRLVHEADPDKSSGAGRAFDKALALAAVEVLEGQHRRLHRRRRRAGSGRPGAR